MFNCLIKLIKFVKFIQSIFNLILLFNLINCLNNDQFKRYEIIRFQINSSNNQLKPFINQGYLEINHNLLSVKINAFEQYFNLVARPAEQLKVRIYENGNLHPPTHLSENYFVGHLFNKSDSKVMGYLNNHRFIGLIYLNNQIYHLDLLNDKSNEEVIMYRESDVISLKNLKASEPIQSDNFDRLYQRSESFKISSSFAKQHQQINKRFKRTFKSKRNEKIVINYPRRPIACHVELIADHTYSARFNYDSNLIVNEMRLQLAKVNEIYQNTDFNQDGFFEGVTLRESSAIIFKEINATGYTYSSLNLNPEEILNAFSTRIQNHCLAFTFLHRDFSMFPKQAATLGLAWLNTIENHAGICSRPNINPQISTNAITVQNVGLLTSYFRGKTRPRAECAQTLAHEIGHLFGARHDDGDDIKRVYPSWKCPSYYLMSSYASFGPTATIFTECSKYQINAALMRKSSCFEQMLAFCGNGIIEPGEECDCGPSNICSQVDRCCVPNVCLLKQECRQSSTQATNRIPFQTPPAPIYRPNTYPPNTYPPKIEQPDNRPNLPPYIVPPNNYYLPPTNVRPPLYTKPPDIDNLPFYDENNIPTFEYEPFKPTTFFQPDNLKTEHHPNGFDIIRTKLPNSKIEKPTTIITNNETMPNKRNKLTSLLDQFDFSNLNWTQILLIGLFIIGPLLFLYCLLKDTFSNEYNDLENKRKPRRKRKGHRRFR